MANPIMGSGRASKRGGQLKAAADFGRYFREGA